MTVAHDDRAAAVLQAPSPTVNKDSMGWYGKFIGAVLGAIVGRGLLGAIIGMFIGHQFDRQSDAERARRRSASAGSADDLRLAFFEATFLVMGHVAKADGRVTEEEIGAARATMRRFSLSDADRGRAIDLFTRGKHPDFPLEATLQRFCALAARRPDLGRLFLQIQLEAALQGNGLNPPTRAIVERIRSTLGISPLEFASLEAMLRMRSGGAQQPGGGGTAQPTAPRLADAYDVLGVKPRATDAEVTKAYRRLMSRNHPDKLVAQGLPESMVVAAHERTQRILEAYETVKNHRGMK